MGGSGGSPDTLRMEPQGAKDRDVCEEPGLELPSLGAGL